MRGKSLFIVLVLAWLAPVVSPAQVAFIANKATSISSVDEATLKNVFTLESKSLGGSRVVLFDLKENTPARAAFCKAIGMTPEAIKKIWMKAVLTGSGEKPIQVGEDEIVQRVASTNGAVGYVSAAKVTDAVKVIFEVR
jgi:hypothetical protein